MVAKEVADITISIDCDGQDDIDAMDTMVKAYHDGCEIVYGVRNDRESDTFFKRTTAQRYYKILNALGGEVIYNHADYRLVSSRVLNELANYKEVNLFLRGMFPLIGFKSTCVEYSRHERLAGSSKYPLSKMLALAFDGITSFSVKPIRIITVLGLAYVKDSFELKIDGAAVDIDPVFSNSDKTFTLTIPYNTMKNYAAGKNVVITYNCTVTADSLSYDYAKNTAKLEYSHNPFDEDDTDTTPDSETYVLNINLDVDKVAESASGEKLTGAKFKLRKSATEYYKWDETNGKVTWVAEGQADVFETENGALKQQVRGLDKGTYYLVETEAPTGYNLLKDPITVEISVSEGNDKKVTYTATAGGQTAAVTNGVVDLTAAQNANQPVATATIINNSGAELPSTGGIGTTIFYVIGAILVLGAGILLVTRRRMNAN